MGWWSNLLARFKRDKSAEPEEEYIDISPGADKPEREPPPAPRSSTWLSRWRPGARRDRQIAWLQAGYSEVLTLMRGINEHLQRQEDVQHKLADAIEKLPNSLDSLQSVGKAAEQQVEVLVLLREQLSSSVSHDKQLVESMNRFNQTLGVMDETSRNSGRTVVELVERSRESDRQLREVLERSEKRFVLLTILFLLAVILGVSAILYTSTHPSHQGRAPDVADPSVPAAVTHENRPPEVIVKQEDVVRTSAPSTETVEDDEESEAEAPLGFFGRWRQRRARVEDETGEDSP